MTTLATKSCTKAEFEFYAPEAQKVSIAGTFNEWNEEKAPLKKDATGKWKLAMALPAGRYEYRYLVDGLWQNDQRAVECVPNAFGTWNCVLEIK
jgi:1,4-alpha-glucan branching enzyme